MSHFRDLMEARKEDVDLSSFEIKDQLNPDLWEDGKLNIVVRRKLLMIAKDFMDKFDFVDFGIDDVVMTGSLANYNWDEKYSDIDLHILVDYEDVNDNVELVENFFDATRKQWNEKHKGIKIYGYPVEVYVQDSNEPHKSTGVYSLISDDWIIEPSREKLEQSDADDDQIQEIAADYMTAIDDIEERYLLVNDGITDDDDTEYISNILNDATHLFDDIKETRKEGLSHSDTEISTGNLIFKTLRRNGYLEKLIDIRTKLYDLLNSLD